MQGSPSTTVIMWPISVATPWLPENTLPPSTTPPPTPVPSVTNTLFSHPADTPATDSARPATVASLSTNTGTSTYFAISSTSGTSCQPRLVQKGMRPVRGSMMPGRPTPMASISPISWPLSRATWMARFAMSRITAS